MKFSEMNKEQKEILVLGVGGAITIIFVMLNLLVKPAQAAAESAKEVIAELETKVDRGKWVMDRDVNVREEAREVSQALLEIVKNELPPSSGRYGWALENITEVFEELGVYFTMDEIRGTRYIPLKPEQKFSPDSVSMWVPYAVTVQFQTSFENLKKILSLIKKDFPYCSVAKMEIRASEQDFENHNINLILEWPVFRFDKDQAWIEEQAEKTK